MTTYEHYNSACSYYDKSTIPVGSELYYAFLASHSSKTLDKIHLLDAGCGTGSHAEYLLRHGLGKVTLLDASKGMLDVAEAKLKKYTEENRVHEFREALLPDIPYDDNTFDAVMSNMCLQHLEDGTDPEFRKTAKALREMFRVLQPGGLLLVQTISHYQFNSCRWFTSFMAERVKQIILSRFPTLDQYKQLIEDAGFISFQRYVPTEENPISNDAFHDYDGVNKREWRDLCGYNLQTPEENEESSRKVNRVKAGGQFDQLINVHEQNRIHSGMLTILVASKTNL